MANLITRADFAPHRQISDSVFDDVLNQYIEDAEFVDLRPLLGSKFYNKIARDVSSFSDLLDGSEFELEGETFSHVGLKRVLVYFSYARYIRFGSATDTPFGFVEKSSPDAQEVSVKEKQIRFKQNQQVAFEYWGNVKEYLDAVNLDGWNEGESRGVKIRISKIS